MISYGQTAEETLNALPQKSQQAVYFMPSDLFMGEYQDHLIKSMNKRKIPTFAHANMEEIKKGLLVALVDLFGAQFARRVGLNVDSILRGEKIFFST